VRWFSSIQKALFAADTLFSIGCGRVFEGTYPMIDRIRNVARHVKREVDAGHDVAVVVSAMVLPGSSEKATWENSGTIWSLVKKPRSPPSEAKTPVMTSAKPTFPAPDQAERAAHDPGCVKTRCCCYDSPVILGGIDEALR
jgi:hypothetical protein